MEIRDITGSIKHITNVNVGSIRKVLLMQKDYILLKFTTDKLVKFSIGDNILNEFVLTQSFKPSVNKKTGGYDYELRFDRYYYIWKNKKFFYAPDTGAREASWSLTADIDTHLGVFIRNLKTLGYKYNGLDFEFAISESVGSGAKLIEYDNIDLISSLTKIAEEWSCEWWITDNVINFGKCEYGTPVDFILDENVSAMSKTGNEDPIPTRIYAFGSERNIPANYRPVDDSITVNGIVQKRLMLPAGVPYIDVYPNLSDEEAIEEIKIFDHIYPRRTNTISDVIKKEQQIDNDNGEKETKIIYGVKDDTLEFKKEYVLPNKELRLAFQSGALNGREYGVEFADGYFLIKEEHNVPNNILYPEKGDLFILSGFDTKFVDVQLLPEAEIELKEEAEKYAKHLREDPTTYECKMMPSYMFNDGKSRTFELGDRVKLHNEAIFDEPRVSRILGYEYSLDMPYDNPTYYVGQKASYSRLGRLEEKVETLEYKEKLYASTNVGVYLITQNDITRPTDRNVLSSLRSLNTFLRKDQDDSTEHLISFLAGLKLGEKYSIDENGNANLNKIKSSIIESLKAKFHELESSKLNSSEGTINTLTALTLFVKSLADVQNLNVKDTATVLNAVVKQSLTSPKFVSGFLGEGFRLAKTEKGDWNLEIDNLTVRKVFQVFELLIQEVKHQGGVIVHSPAGGKITKVTDGGSYWRCEIESADTFVKDDLVLCQQFTGKNIKRYWRLAISAGDGFVNLSKTDCEANSAIPEVDDEIATLGNKTNTARQSAYLISVVGADAPYTAYYSGINSYSLKGKEYTRIGNLEGVVSPVFGTLKGSGAHLVNAYVQGLIHLQNGKSVETVISETSNKLSSDIGKVRTELKGDISKSKEETKGEINSSVSSVRNELNSTIAKAEEQFNTGINQTKTELSSNISSVKQELEGKINTDIQVSKESITKQINQSKQEAEAAAKAYTDEQDKAKLTQAKSYADGKVTAEEKRAIADANAKLAAAKKYADAADAKLKTEQQAYADGKITASEEKLLQTANDNLAAAKAYAEAQDEALKVKTDAYADGKVTAEEKRAIADANAKLAAAKKYAEAQDKLLKTQQEAYADGKVTEAEKRAIAEATNKVNAAKSELNSLISKAQSTANDAKSAVDGLEIGRRNLLKNSNKGWKNSSYPTATLYFAEQLKNGERFSIRIYGRLNDNSNNNWSIYNSGGNLSVLTISRSSYNKIGGFYEGTGVWRTNKDVKNTHINIYGIPNSKLENSIDKVMMIRGNKPTDWTPAPEDLETKINEVQTSVTKEITKVRQDFQITEGQINGKITEVTQLVNEAKTTSGETKKTLEQTTARINQFDTTAKKFEGTLGEITKKQGEVENSITNLNATANSLTASVNGFKETEVEIKATANRIEATHKGIILEASEKSARKAIDDLEIGGRNYFAFKGMGAYTSYNTAPKRVGNTGIETTYTRDVGNILTVKNGSTWKTAVIEDNMLIAVHGYIKINGQIPTSMPFSSKVPNTYYTYFQEPIYDAKTGYFCLFANTKTSKSNWVIHASIKNIKKGDVIFINNLKLEKGTKPTDWTPAPEDFESQITETKASLKVLNDKLVAEVSKTNGISKELTTVKQDHNSFKVQVKTDISGAINSNNEVIKSSFEMKEDTISLLGKSIVLTGKITFNSLENSVKSKINNTELVANQAKANATTALSNIEKVKGEIPNQNFLYEESGEFLLSNDFPRNKKIDVTLSLWGDFSKLTMNTSFYEVSFGGETSDYILFGRYRKVSDSLILFEEGSINVNNSNLDDRLVLQIEASDEFTIRAAKLEIGHKATYWTPSPEDKVTLARLDSTIIDGGFIKTSLIKAKSIKAEKIDIDDLFAQRIKTGNIEATDGAYLGGWKIVGSSIKTRDGYAVNTDPYKRAMIGMEIDGGNFLRINDIGGSMLDIRANKPKYAAHIRAESKTTALRVAAMSGLSIESVGGVSFHLRRDEYMKIFGGGSVSGMAIKTASSQAKLSYMKEGDNVFIHTGAGDNKVRLPHVPHIPGYTVVIIRDGGDIIPYCEKGVRIRIGNRFEDWCSSPRQGAFVLLIMGNDGHWRASYSTT